MRPSPSRPWAALPALLLAAMAGLQALRIQVQDLNSWADGPGFAMFAKPDALPARFTRLHLETERGLERVAPFAGLDPAIHAWRVLPSEARGRRLADALLAEAFVRGPDGLRPGTSGGAPERVLGAQVELWSLRVEPGRLVPYRKRVVRRELAGG